MNLADYQLRANQTAIYPGRGELPGLTYCTLGLCGEAGELANKVKKILRDHGGKITELDRENLAAEIGDCLWYVAQLSGELGFSLETIAARNLQKLAARQQAGRLGGSGDGR